MYTNGTTIQDGVVNPLSQTPERHIYRSLKHNCTYHNKTGLHPYSPEVRCISKKLFPGSNLSSEPSGQSNSPSTTKTPEIQWPVLQRNSTIEQAANRDGTLGQYRFKQRFVARCPPNIICTNSGLFSGPIGISLSEIYLKMQQLWYKTICFQISSAKWSPFYSASMYKGIVTENITRQSNKQILAFNSTACCGPFY